MGPQNSGCIPPLSRAPVATHSSDTTAGLMKRETHARRHARTQTGSRRTQHGRHVPDREEAPGTDERETTHRTRQTAGKLINERITTDRYSPPRLGKDTDTPEDCNFTKWPNEGNEKHHSNRTKMLKCLDFK